MLIYCCYRGAVSNLALTDPRSFAFRDAKGRDWICREGTARDLQEGGASLVAEVMQAQQALSRHFPGCGGTALTIQSVASRSELAQVLSEIAD